MTSEREIAQNATEGPWMEPVADEYLVGQAAAEFIATFNPKRVLELLDENERLRDQNARLMAGNHTAAERQDWRKQFMDTHDDNLALRARLRAQNLSCQTGACGECGTCKRAGIEDEFTAMEREIHQLRARLAAVEKLHTPVEARAANGATITVCQKCAGDLAYVFDGEFNWPCDDIKAARGE